MRVLIAIVAIWLLTGAFLWQAYNVCVDHANRSTAHLSFVMAEIAEQSLTINHLVVDSMLDWIAEDDVGNEEQYRTTVSSLRFFERLSARVSKLPSVDVATFIADDGRVLNYSRAYPPAPINLADRDYFIEQMEGKEPSFSIGSTVKNRGTGEWTFYLAKNVHGNDGRKLGVVITGAGVDFFATLFRSILRKHESRGSTQDDAAFLVRNDGVLLAATSLDAPLGLRVFPQRGQDGTSPSLSDAIVDLGLSPGSFRASSPLTTFPAYVVVSTAPDPFLVECKQTAWAMTVAGIVLSMFSMGIGWRSYHLLQARDRVLRQEGEQRVLSAIFASPAALAALLTRDRRIVHCNSAFSTSLESMIHRGKLEYPPDADLGGRLTAFLEGDEPHADFTLRVNPKGCSSAFLRFSAARMNLGQGSDQIALLGYDDTQRMKSEAHIIQSSKLITLGEMATSMAHELNQPLNVIKMAAQSALFEFEEVEKLDHGSIASLIANTDSDIFIQARLRRVVEQVDRAAAIIDHMRIFGRVPQGQPPLIDAVATCRSAIQLLEHQLRDAQVNVVFRPEDNPQYIRCHPVLLEQVLVNLLLNARDAVAGISVALREVRIEVRHIDQEVIIIVSDNGPGIPPELRDRVFEPFFTTKSADKGTGLGLSVSYGIVRDSGGKLELMDPAQGCAFRIIFPAMAAPESQSG